MFCVPTINSLVGLELKSSNDLLKRIVLTKVLDNPKLFANPEVQKILGT